MSEIIIVIILIIIVYLYGGISVQQSVSTSIMIQVCIALGVDPDTANSIIPQIVDAANNAGVNPVLAVALAMEESGLNNNAVNPSGATGLFQLMPETARELNVDPTTVSGNIQGGIAYMKIVSNQFNGDINSILGAFDVGPTGMKNLINKYGNNWVQYAPSETQGVIAKVSNIISQFNA